MRSQPISSKLAEIKYRSLIVKQHLGSSLPFANEPTAGEFTRMLTERLARTEKAFHHLQKRGVGLSPFLEIGAEYGLAAALLKSKFKAYGAAVDISLHSLSKAGQFAQKFNLKTPETICADALNLPFKSNSFPFVFIYETLHHFPDPKPVLAEIYRVLSPGGCCLVGGDPIAQTLQIRIWRRPTKLRLWEKFLKATLILPFVSHIGKTEVEHGILEEAFTLSVWQKSLSIFDQVEVKIETPLGLSQSLTKSTHRNWLSPNLALKLILFLLGGGLSAVCFKKGASKNSQTQIKNLLICPNCQISLKKETSLQSSGNNFFCLNCNSNYKDHQNVLILLEKNLERAALKIKK